MKLAALRLLQAAIFAAAFLSACEEKPDHQREILGVPSGSQSGNPKDGDVVADNSKVVPSDDNKVDTIALNGKQLYADLCVKCHGTLEQAEHAGKNAEAIKAAINNVPDMSSLKSLSDAKIALIGGELVNVTPPPPPALALDGMKLYMDECMGCHGPKPQTTVDEKTIVAVKAARVNIPEMAGNATDDNDLAAILKYLLEP